MKIAPIDITHKSFSKKWNGLDPAEVADFMTALALEMEDLIKERNALKEEVREKDLNILEFKERDQILKDTITTAHKMAEKMRGDADRESRLIINDAHQKAEIIVRDARDSLKKIYQEINDLKRIRLQFETRLKSLAQSYLAILNQEDKSFVEVLNEGSRTPSASV